MKLGAKEGRKFVSCIDGLPVERHDVAEELHRQRRSSGPGRDHPQQLHGGRVAGIVGQNVDAECFRFAQALRLERHRGFEQNRVA